jgi:hypothetical protein
MSELIVSNYSTISQDRAHEGVSDKYSFIPTSRVLDVLSDYGFVPAKVTESRTLKDGKKGFQKHMIRLRDRNLVPQVQQEFPEIVVTNSHCGSAAFKIMVGFYRLICANGMVVGDTMQSYSITHKGYTDHAVENALRSITGVLPALEDTVRSMRAIELNRNEAVAFASSVVDMAWDGSGYSVDPDRLLTQRRYDDRGVDLWLVFNRVQENVIKGDVRQVRADGSRIRSREVKNIDRNINLNKAMWSLAEKMRELKVAG